MSAEQIELCRIVVAQLLIMREGLMVASDLGEVGGLELQGKLHQRIGDVGGGFIGDGVFRGAGLLAWASSLSPRTHCAFLVQCRECLCALHKMCLTFGGHKSNGR